MITHYVSKDLYRGLSTDTKPTDAHNGDAFEEIDTGTIFYYDEDNETWIEQGAETAEGGSVG